MTDLHKKSVFNRIFIGADHRGFELKEHIKDWLQEYELTVVDCGAHAYEVSDDYPDFAFLVAQNVMKTQGSCGIVICGSGVGVSIVANKIDGVRSVLGFKAEQVVLARNDDDVNCLAIPSEFISPGESESLVRSFLTTEFSTRASRARRLQKIFDIEQFTQQKSPLE